MILQKIGKFLRKIFGMSSLKDKYDSEKACTIDRFYNLIEISVSYMNSPSSTHFLRNAITILSYDDDSISLKFLNRTIHLRFNINLTSSSAIEAFKEELDLNNYPNRKLIPITDLNIKFSLTSNSNGFRDFQFNGKSYCIGNHQNEFALDYFGALQTSFFPISKSPSS